MACSRVRCAAVSIEQVGGGLPSVGCVRRDLEALAPGHAAEPEVAQQAGHRAACDPGSFPVQLGPDLLHAVDLNVLVPDAADLRPQT